MEIFSGDSLSKSLTETLRQYWASFSYFSLLVAGLFFAASLSPSLVPRTYLVQGLLSGVAASVGYGVGVLLIGLWRYLELPPLGEQTARIAKRVSVAAVVLIATVFLWRATIWQNSIRELMQMPAETTAYPLRVAVIAVLTALVLVALARLLGWGYLYFAAKLNQYVPRRIANAASVLIVALLTLFVLNGVVARGLLTIADGIFLRLDNATDEGISQPTNPLACGSGESLIAWDTIGRMGKTFVDGGPKQSEIAEFTGREAKRPLRIYAGLSADRSLHEQAALALEELKRIDAFSRKLLIVATPTGTGWLDPGAVDTVEYLHGGDTAIVALQYSYLPSWMTLLVDPNRSRDAAHALFTPVYDYWRTLPKAGRPKLYLHGLSLGSLGSESSADLLTILEDPIDGALWSGPPFPSVQWKSITKHRNTSSPAWLPEFRDGRTIRFMNQQTEFNAGKPWGPLRIVYLQHASDPMVFFSPDLAWQRPAWLAGERGPDVSPYLDWYPIVTFLQVAFDLPLATSVPRGYGHNYAAADYIEGWQAVTAPEGWDAEDTERLKKVFAD